MTLERLAAAAGVNESWTRYDFGNKAGLVGALVGFWLHWEFERDPTALPLTAHKDLVRTLVDGKRHTIETTDNIRGFYDMLSQALRDEGLRRRIAASYPWWAEQNPVLWSPTAQGRKTGPRHGAAWDGC